MSALTFEGPPCELAQMSRSMVHMFLHVFALFESRVAVSSKSQSEKCSPTPPSQEPCPARRAAEPATNPGLGFPHNSAAISPGKVPREFHANLYALLGT